MFFERAVAEFWMGTMAGMARLVGRCATACRLLKDFGPAIGPAAGQAGRAFRASSSFSCTCIGEYGLTI